MKKPLCDYCKRPIEDNSGWAMQETSKGNIIFHSECGEMSDPDFAEFQRRARKFLDGDDDELQLQL